MPEGLLAHHLEGEGEVVLLLNGGMMSLAAWQAMAKRLAASYRVLRCDFRGQLLSPGDGYVELSDHVQDLLDLLDDRAISRAHLIGVSFGAVVGLLLAASAPERVSSIVAVTATDVVTEGSLRGIERLRDVIAEVLNGGDRSLFHDAIVADIYSAGYVEANRRDFAARRFVLEALPEGWFRNLDTLLECAGKIDLRPHLSAISAPAMVVIAGEDRLMPEERSRSLAAALGAEIEMLEESGHALLTEHPEWLTRKCLAFLRKCRQKRPVERLKS